MPGHASVSVTECSLESLSPASVFSNRVSGKKWFERRSVFEMIVKRHLRPRVVMDASADNSD